MKKWLIYGAYGYSGKLIAEYAKEQGLSPILSGRNPEKLKALGAELDLETRCFSLDDIPSEHLSDVGLVVHAAGPFSKTALPMAEACIQNGCHYLDITGEIDVFEQLHCYGMTDRARREGVVLCPGVGFDVVPTDCLALTLAEALPKATHLVLAFASQGRFSPGTAKTMVEGLGFGPRRRVNGQIKTAPILTKTIDFGGVNALCMNLGWGDVSTAHYTTGIPNIEVYFGANEKMVKNAKMSRWFRWILRTNFLQNRLKRKVEASVQGPNAEQRAKSPTYLWGEVRDGEKTLQARLKTANGYTVTAHAPVAMVQNWFENDWEVFGTTTPARLMGKDFIERLEGSNKIEITET